MKMKMLGDKVLAKPIDNPKTSKGGIIIPDTIADKAPRKAKVVSVGPGHVDDNGIVHHPGVKEGEIVLFPSHAPSQIKIDGQVYLVLRGADLLGVEEQ